MIKILKEGIYKEKEFYAKCSNCDCVFSYDKTDLHNTDYGDWDYSHHWYVLCPCCMKKIFYFETYDSLEDLEKDN